MPLLRSLPMRWYQPVVAGLLAVLLALLGLVAASESFHSWLHADGATKHTSCSACALAKGQVDSVTVLPWLVISSLVLVWILSCPDCLRPQAADFSVASSRGPPASVSFL